MANFFGGFIKRIEKPQDTHPPSVPQDFSQYENEYVTYCIEQEKTISELESGIHTNDDPGEIAKKALAAACAFYDADWAGVIEIDLELNIWATGWWYNIDPSVKKLEKLQKFENLMVMPSIVEAIKKQTPIIFSDVEDIAKTSPKEYQVYKRLEVNSVMVDELLSIFAQFEDYDGIHHFATQALNLVPENVKAQYWLVYSIYHSGVVALAKREIEKAKCRLTSEEFDTLQKFICKDESLPYGQLFE